MVNLINQYDSTIMSLTESQLTGSEVLPEELLMDTENNLSIYYAPFDWVNTNAKVILMGITPGKTQAINALNAYRIARNAGHSVEQSHQIAKQSGSFSGSLRKNLVALLDHIQFNTLLNIESCDSLFGANGSHNQLIHSMSSLTFPVFKNGENYNGTPKIKNSALLKKHLQYCADIVQQMPEAMIVPLGPKVTEAMDILIQEGSLQDHRVLNGLPHPSPSNSERIQYFLGMKQRENLSVKTNPMIIDKAKESINQKMGLMLS